MEAVMASQMTPMDPAESHATIDQVVQLIGTLYNSNNPSDQNEANRRLTKLQSSNEAWDICWLLLNPNNHHPVEVQFFAAQLLVLKINQGWSQYDEEWLETHLRGKLFEVLAQYSSSPNAAKLVVERLSLALANFALHSIPTFWPNAIDDILGTFTSQNLSLNISHERICEILLKILIYIPEEYSVMLPLQEHRAKLNGQMILAGPVVFKFLNSLLQMDKSTLTLECKESTLKCMTSWTRNSQTSLLELDDSKSILDVIYSLIVDDELCSLACSALAATFSSQKAENYSNSILAFIPKIARLEPVIKKYLVEDEIECAIQVYSLVINFSEQHARLLLRVVLQDGISLEGEQLVNARQDVFAILKIILDCTASPGVFGIDEKYSEITFPFWYTFFENFCYYQDSYSDMICDLFDPLVDSLLQTLTIKARYPPSAVYHQSCNDEQREAFRCYRQDLSDNISLIVQFPNARERILTQLHDQLSQELEEMLRFSSGAEKPWQKIESTVFALKSMSEAIPFDENFYVPKIFELLSRIPFNESQAELYCTVAEMIAAYADWLFTHSVHLGTAYTILFMGVTSCNPNVRLMSTLSLKDLTHECQTVSQPYATHIVKTCTDVIMQQGHNLTCNEKSRLMFTIGTTLAMTSADNIATSLETLTSPIICDLGVRAQVDPATDPACVADILDRLTMINSLIESLYVKQFYGNDYEDYDENHLHAIDFHSDIIQDIDSNQPTIGLLKRLVPTLVMITEKYRSDEAIMEKISSTIKRASKSLGLEFKPVLREYLAIIVNAYEPITNSNILEGATTLYMAFRVDESVHEFLRDAFAQITDKTLKTCVENPLRQLSMTVENYFKYAHLVIRKYPTYLVKTPSSINVEYIYKLALASLELPEKRTICEICNFLSTFRQRSIGCDPLHKIFVEHLDVLLSNIFNIFGGTYQTPRNAIEHVADLLYSVTSANEARPALQRIVEQDNFPTCHVSQEQKSRLVSQLLHEKNRRKYKEICSEFVLVARNLNRLI